MTKRAIPEGFHTATPYMNVPDPDAALRFYEKAFGAQVLERHADDKGVVQHAEVKIGDSPIMLGPNSNYLGMTWKSPSSLGGVSMSLYLYVDDADAWLKRAIEAGAKELEPVTDKYYGDRVGAVRDPFGYVFWIATRLENLTAEEIARRGAAAKS
jgi:PhnB protein